MTPGAPIGGLASRRERGAGLLGCLLWILLLTAVFYVGSRFVVPYSQYWRFKAAMISQAEAAETNTDAEIRSILAQSAADLDIPVGPREVRIRRGRGTITISAAWAVEIVLPKYRRTLHFHPSVSASVGDKPE